MAGSMTMKFSVVTLSGPLVTLEPLRKRHLDKLSQAAQSSDIWRYMSADLSAAGALQPWYEETRQLEKAGDQLPFAIRSTGDDVLIGSTRYLNIAPEHLRLEIGWTWLAPAYWNGRANAATKLLLFEHAFEKLGALRVELRTDALNKRARRAIAKLGATEEGTLRSHMLMPGGRVRDTVQFAVTREDWPSVCAKLTSRIND